jgi:TolB protein
MFGVVTFIIIFLASFAGLANNGVQAATDMRFVESQLTSNTSDQVNPDIYEYALNWWAAVWQDNRNGNWDIYMFYQHYLGEGQWDVQWDTRITTNSGNNLYPKIYDDTIVYQSDRNGNWDIYMYNLTSKAETQITTNTANQGPSEIYGDIIVWQDWRNMLYDTRYLAIYPGMDIYMYNLTSHTEEPLPLTEEACFSPTISEDQVVYIAENYWRHPYTGATYYYPYVCAYNLSTGTKFNVAAGQVDDVPFHWLPRTMSSPALDGPITAWTEKPENGGWNVVVKNITTGLTWRSGGVEGPYYPAVSGNYVAYQGIINGNWDIYLYDFTSNSPYDATNNAARQENPAISSKYANFIVYQDNRNGNWDIYLTSFWYGVGAAYPPAKPVTPSRVITNLQEVKSRIADTPTSDFAGANIKVKENRRNAILNQLDSAIISIENAVDTQNLKLRTKYFQSAIDQLDGLIGKLDGWSSERGADIPGSGFTPDWITAPLYLDQVIRSCRNNLQTLLNGIS